MLKNQRFPALFSLPWLTAKDQPTHFRLPGCIPCVFEKHEIPHNSCQHLEANENRMIRIKRK